MDVTSIADFVSNLLFFFCLDGKLRLCSYKVGKTLGQGTYAVVKEAVHIKTGQYYACKVISKRLMEGREHMVRNEIAALKKVSQVG